MVLTVKNFLGCVDLKIACIVLASVRMILSVIFFFVVMTWFLEAEASFRGIVEFALLVYMVAAAAVFVANILVTYWFIKGAISVRVSILLLNKITNEISFPHRAIQSKWSTT